MADGPTQVTSQGDSGVALVAEEVSAPETGNLDAEHSHKPFVTADDNAQESIPIPSVSKIDQAESSSLSTREEPTAALVLSHEQNGLLAGAEEQDGVEQRVSDAVSPFKETEVDSVVTGRDADAIAAPQTERLPDSNALPKGEVSATEARLSVAEENGDEEGVQAAAPTTEALSRVSSHEAAILPASTPPPLSPERPINTPPTPGGTAAGPKKFASSLSVNKKFMDKMGVDNKITTSGLAKAAPIAGRSASSLSPIASTSAGSLPSAGPRLLTGKLSNALPGAPAGQWARGANVASGSFLAFQPAAGRGAGAMRGRGRGGRPTGDVWARQPSSDAAGFGPNLGDFPTAAEAAKSKQLKANAIAAANAAKENASRQAAEAADRAAQAYNQHLLENLDGFRGLHLDPNASHWDEMEDDDIGDIVDFGDGAQYKLEDQIEEPASQVPPAPIDDFDRGRANGPERRLFNANLNKLESVAPRRDAPPMPQPGTKIKGRAAAAAAPGPQRATSPVTARSQSPVRAREPSAGAAQSPGPATQQRPKLPPAPAKSPWAKPSGDGVPPPVDESLPSLAEAAAIPAKSVPVPIVSAPTPTVPIIARPPEPIAPVIEESNEPIAPKINSKEFAEKQESSMRENAERARKRREEQEAAEEAAKKERLRAKMAALDALSPPKPASVELPHKQPVVEQSVATPAVPTPVEDKRPTPATSDSWRIRSEVTEIVKPVAPVRSAEPALTEPTSRPALAENVQLLRKPSAPAAEGSGGEVVPPKRERVTKQNRLDQPQDNERFWRRTVPSELSQRPEEPRPLPNKRSAKELAPPRVSSQQSKSTKPSRQNARSSPRALEAAVPVAEDVELAPSGKSVHPFFNKTFDDAMARIRDAMIASREPPAPADQAFMNVMAEGAGKAHATVRLPGWSGEERARPSRPLVKLEPEELLTAAILDHPPTSVWKTYQVRMAKLPSWHGVSNAESEKAFWARDRDRGLDVLTWQPQGPGWQRYNRDWQLFKQPGHKGKGARPPRVHLVPTSKALEHLASRTLLAPELPPQGFLTSLNTSPPISRTASRAQGRADAETLWRRTPDAPAASTIVPDLSLEVETSLFGLEPSPATITLALPSSKASPARRRLDVPLRSRASSTAPTENSDLVENGLPQVRLPSSSHRRQKSSKLELNNAPVRPSAVVIVDETEPVPPLMAAMISSDEETFEIRPLASLRSDTPPQDASALPVSAAAAKPLPRLSAMAESVHAVPFAPQMILSELPPKQRALMSSAPAAWPSTTGSNTSLSIIDPHLKNVWGPSDKVDPSTSHAQENSLIGIVDELPAANVAALSDLKSDDGISTSPSIEATVAHAGPFDSAPSPMNRDAPMGRQTAAEALAAVGGLPFGRQYDEQDFENIAFQSSSPSSPPQISASSPTYYQPFYSAAPPTAAMAYGVVSPGMIYASPWMNGGQPAAYATHPTRIAYPTSPDALPSTWTAAGYGPYAAAMPASYAKGSMRSSSRPPIGSGRPGNNSYRPVSAQYEPFTSSPSLMSTPLPGAAPLSVRSPSGTSYRSTGGYRGASSQFSNIPQGAGQSWA